MPSIGDMIGRLVLDSKDWISGMKATETQTESSAQKVEGSLSKMAGAVVELGKGLAGLELAAKLREFGEDALKESAEFGKFKSSLVAMTGDGKDVQEFMERIHEIAKASPFSFPELSQSAQKMVQLGGNMEQVAKT